MLQGRHLLVQAGNWVHNAVVLPTGLRIAATRLLPATPAALRPARDGLAVQIVTLASSSPRLRTVNLREPAARPLQGDPGQLRYEWQRRLGLTLDPKGRSTPFSPVVIPAP